MRQLSEEEFGMSAIWMMEVGMPAANAWVTKAATVAHL